MTKEIEKHLTANSWVKKRQVMLANFLGGLAWGFGTVVGATLVVALLLGLLKILGFVPFLGDLVSQISSNIESRRLPTGPVRENVDATPGPIPQYYLVPAPTPSPSPSPSDEATSSATPKP